MSSKDKILHERLKVTALTLIDVVLISTPVCRGLCLPEDYKIKEILLGAEDNLIKLKELLNCVPTLDNCTLCTHEVVTNTLIYGYMSTCLVYPVPEEEKSRLIRWNYKNLLKATKKVNNYYTKYMETHRKQSHRAKLFPVNMNDVQEEINRNRGMCSGITTAEVIVTDVTVNDPKLEEIEEVTEGV